MMSRHNHKRTSLDALPTDSSARCSLSASHGRIKLPLRRQSCSKQLGSYLLAYAEDTWPQSTHKLHPFKHLLHPLYLCV